MEGEGVIRLGLQDEQCASCGTVGYGAGHCAGCWRIVCYDCGKPEARDRCVGEFWFCPECSQLKSAPKFVDYEVAR